MAGKVVKVEGYSTHQQALVKYACMAKEGELIVELGCGFYSTPLLDSIAYVNKVRFKCYYQEIDWQKTVEPLCPNTEFIHVANWNVWKLEHDAHLVMLDNEELVVNRYKQIARSLKDKSKYILCHDADIYPKRGINLSELHNGEMFDALVPHTYVIDCADTTPKLKEPIKKVVEEPKVEEVEVDETPDEVVTTVHTNGSKPNVKLRRDTPEPPIELVSKIVNGNEVFRIDSRFTSGRKPIEPCEPLKGSEIPRLHKRLPKGLTAVVCCFTAGGEYDAHYQEYIERLSKGVQDNTTDDIDIYCITNMTLQSFSCVTRIEPLVSTWKGWHIKSEIFREDLWRGYDRVLYIDLDTQITGNIDDIVNSESRCTMLRDFYKPSIWETGMMYFCPSDFKGFYEQLVSRKAGRSVKDAVLISDFIKKKKIQPDFFQDNYRVGSYKVSLVDEDLDHNKFQVICYHGTPRPHHIDWDLNIRTKNAGPLAGRERKALKRSRRNVDVEEIWKGEDVFVIGGGPSLKGIDLNKLLEGQKVLGINDGYLYDCCDICFFGDTVWHVHHKEGIHKWGKPLYSTSGVFDEEVNFLDLKGQGLSIEKDTLGWNSNSGFAGMNLALLFGAQRIFLLGFDMDFGHDGESNWHPNIRNVSKNTYQCFLRTQRNIADDFKRHFSEREVYVCTMPNYDSKIEIFPKVSFNELLEIDEELLYIKKG